MDGENDGKPYFFIYTLGVPLPAICPTTQLFFLIPHITGKSFIPYITVIYPKFVPMDWDGFVIWNVAPSVSDAQKTFMIIRHIHEGDEAPGGIFILDGFVSPKQKCRWRKNKRWEFFVAKDVLWLKGYITNSWIEFEKIVGKRRGFLWEGWLRMVCGKRLLHHKFKKSSKWFHDPMKEPWDEYVYLPKNWLCKNHTNVGK